jgi:RNA-directed DNA polymerase
MIRRRLRALLRKQARRRPSVGNRLVDHLRWPNAFFANAGLFALHTAWQTARQSR